MEKSYIVINVVLKHLIVFATLAYVRLVEKSLVPATQILMHAKTVELILVNVGEVMEKKKIMERMVKKMRMERIITMIIVRKSRNKIQYLHHKKL